MRRLTYLHTDHSAPLQRNGTHLRYATPTTLCRQLSRRFLGLKMRSAPALCRSLALSPRRRQTASTRPRAGRRSGSHPRPLRRRGRNGDATTANETRDRSECDAVAAVNVARRRRTRRGDAANAVPGEARRRMARPQLGKMRPCGQ